MIVVWRILPNWPFIFPRSKNNDSKKGIQMTLGYAIYIGWVGAALAIAIAVLLFLGCCGSSEDEEEYDEYTPAHPMSYKSRKWFINIYSFSKCKDFNRKPKRYIKSKPHEGTFSISLNVTFSIIAYKLLRCKSICVRYFSN